MPNFKQIFKKDKSDLYPQRIDYKERKIFLVDKFPVSNKDVLIISIESTESEYVQGFYIGISGYLKTKNGATKKRKNATVCFWEDTEVLDPKHIEVKVFTKDPYVFIGNIWEVEDESGKKKTCWAGGDEWRKFDKWGGSAIYSEEIVGGRRYFCNDGDLDDDFDDIIFTVRKVKSE